MCVLIEGVQKRISSTVDRLYKNAIFKRTIISCQVSIKRGDNPPTLNPFIAPFTCFAYIAALLQLDCSIINTSRHIVARWLRQTCGVACPFYQDTISENWLDFDLQIYNPSSYRFPLLFDRSVFNRYTS